MKIVYYCIAIHFAASGSLYGIIFLNSTHTVITLHASLTTSGNDVIAVEGTLDPYHADIWHTPATTALHVTLATPQQNTIKTVHRSAKKIAKLKPAPAIPSFAPWQKTAQFTVFSKQSTQKNSTATNLVIIREQPDRSFKISMLEGPAIRLAVLKGYTGRLLHNHAAPMKGAL